LRAVDKHLLCSARPPRSRKRRRSTTEGHRRRRRARARQRKPVRGADARNGAIARAAGVKHATRNDAGGSDISATRSRWAAPFRSGSTA
jgi:hypothetical protein